MRSIMQKSRHIAARGFASQASPSSQGRWAYTAEICVSKIFPAGFGWQTASCIAPFAADTAGFALCTGIGDATGVIIGHNLYKMIQNASGSSKIDTAGEFQTSIWLGTGALFAGTSWQPIVDTLHDGMGLGFIGSFFGVTAGCGAMFMAGLALGRAIYPWMPGYTAQSFKQDLGLCVSIGGATAMFVATDCSFVGAQADLLYTIVAPAFNILDSHSTIQGATIAGSSTFTGFAVFQAVQNLLPAGSNWMDNNNPYCTVEEVDEVDTATA